MVESPDDSPEWLVAALETIVVAGAASIPDIGGPLSVMVQSALTRARANVARAGAAAVEEAGGVEALAAAMRQEPRIANLILIAGEAAARTALREKCILMGRLVGRAARESALIDETELMMAVIEDLEGPHFRVLADFERRDVHVGPNRRVEAALAVVGSCPPPVKAALVRHGLLDTVLAYEGHEVIAGLNEFGRKILQHLRSANAEAEREEGHWPPK